MYKERKETTHEEIDEITYINIYKPNISTMYVKWPQDQYTKDNVSKIERKEKIQESSLHPSYKHSPYLLYLPSPYEYDYSHLKTTPLFVTSDKWVST